MTKDNRKPSMTLTLEKSRETKSIIKPLQVTLLFLFNYPKRGVAGSTIKISPNRFQGYKQTPVLTCARVPAF